MATEQGSAPAERPAGDRIAGRPQGQEVARAEGGRYIVVGGRRWRATDPGIPETLRQELVNELMRARRAVKNREQDARAWVQDAKVALGERGEPWWQEPSPEARRQRIGCVIRALLRHRAGRTICPSDAARVVGADSWRPLMPEVRDVAGELVLEGECVAQQKGEAVELAAARGPVRLAPGPRLTGPAQQS